MNEERVRRDAARREAEAFHERLHRDHPDLRAKERAWESGLSPAFKQALPPELKDAFDRSVDKRTASQWRGLDEMFLAQSAEFRTEHAGIAAIRAREPKFVTTMVVRERKEPRPSYVHLGGDFTRKGPSVSPGVPSVLPPLPPGASPDRMTLARWLTDPRHPLTARVTVNRVWQAYFGRGLVETENDFGTQGTPPSHPELLDWLACEFAEGGWGVKALHRRIVTSATYRQSSRRRPDLDRVDPDNRLLGRQSRLRLDAELIRDAALAVSGALAEKMGGPGVYPPQPEGVTALGQVKRPWPVSEGADRDRRGVYTFLFRATPYPSLTVFDAPAAVQACTRRPRSNTPLQALTLLNDRAFYECAEALAGRVLREGGATDASRTERAFRLCFGRAPTEVETTTVAGLLASERAEAASAGGAASAERAAWTGVARVLLNLDEFITRE